MTPEERAQSVLHFLDEYLNARDIALLRGAMQHHRNMKDAARSFLGMSLVALVTDARKVDE